MKLTTFIVKKISLTKLKRDTKPRRLTLSKLQAFQTGKFVAEGTIIEPDNKRKKIENVSLKDLKKENVGIVKIDNLSILV